MKNTFLRIVDLIKKGKLIFMIKGISKRVLSKTEAFGLKRDLDANFKASDAQIDISLRPFRAEDRNYFEADLQNAGLIEKDIQTCYVVTNIDDIPFYRHWLMDATQNKKIKEFWRQLFPTLQEDEALIENVFTIPEYRGKGIMPVALDKMAQQYKGSGIRYLMLFVELNNIPSLKGAHRSGFSPFVLRTEKWFFLKRTIRFQDVSKDVMDMYSKTINS
ncbi:GNAT family N-acetyltransferase [Winogradskyella sp. PG-2]|uniref:GNAT family N-acetyltransferase n=1 Tax=Winogradskyella sp. PG-2 TaxID=754409 RepID=UPI00045891A9|nr:GNAT family N-acetyltransferase [Winogradskyella sp. PG-2]BAO74432.1 hypothetical protein WPG_0202 [Winogradskyella sp. PG-2]